MILERTPLLGDRPISCRMIEGLTGGSMDADSLANGRDTPKKSAARAPARPS
jgi:hypothetical protein